MAKGLSLVSVRKETGVAEPPNQRLACNDTAQPRASPGLFADPSHRPQSAGTLPAELHQPEAVHTVGIAGRKNVAMPALAEIGVRELHYAGRETAVAVTARDQRIIGEHCRKRLRRAPGFEPCAMESPHADDL